MVGLSEPFKLLARREGPTESGYNYAMEKRQGKAGLKSRKRKERKEERRALFQRMENSTMGKPATFK